MELTDGPVSQVYGANPQFEWQLGYGHLGVDWAVGEGTPCRAIADGTVLWADWGQSMPADQCSENMMIFRSPNSGIMVLVQHDGWRCLYAHGSRTDMNVGDRVVRGQTVMLSGTTGNSTGPHLHGESLTAPAPGTPPYGRYNLRAQIEMEDKLAAAHALAENERWVGPANILQRAKPQVESGEVRLIKANTKEAFTGYYIGEMVDLGGVRSNIWYADDLGYSWAGGFTTQELRGLRNLTPPPAPTALPPNQRRMRARDGDVRPEPRYSPVSLRKVKGGSLENFSHWVSGQTITLDGITSDLWYKDSLGYMWAGFFQTQSKAGLVQFVPPIATPAPPVVVVTPASPATAAPSLSAEIPSVTEVVLAASNKYNAGNKIYPARGIVIHQFATATPEEDAATNRLTVRVQSLINTFTDPEAREASCHIAVDGERVVQFVSLKDRAWHAGATGNDHWGIEVYGAMDPVTIRTLVRVIADLFRLAGGPLPLYRHNEFMSTACGRHVPLEQLRVLTAPAPAPAPVKPAPTPAQPVPAVRVTDTVLSAAARELAAMVDVYINERK